MKTCIAYVTIYASPYTIPPPPPPLPFNPGNKSNVSYALRLVIFQNNAKSTTGVINSDEYGAQI